MPFTQTKYFAEWYDRSNKLVRIELRPSSDTAITPVLLYIASDAIIRYKVPDPELPYGIMPSYFECSAFLKDTDLQTALLADPGLQVWVYYNASLFWKGWLMPVSRRKQLSAGITPLDLVASDFFKMKESSPAAVDAPITVQSFVNDAIDTLGLGFTCTVDVTMRFKDYADETVTLGDMSFFPVSMQADFSKKTMRSYFEILHELSRSCLHNVFQESGNIVFEPSRGVGKTPFTSIIHFDNAEIEYFGNVGNVEVSHDIPKYPSLQVNRDPDFQRFKKTNPVTVDANNLLDWEHEPDLVLRQGSAPSYLRVAGQTTAVQGPKQVLDFISYEPGNMLRVIINAKVIVAEDEYTYTDLNYNFRYVLRIGDLYLNDSLEWQSTPCERVTPYTGSSFTHIDDIVLPDVAGPAYIELPVPVFTESTPYPFDFEYQYGYVQVELVPGAENTTLQAVTSTANAGAAQLLKMEIPFNASTGPVPHHYYLMPDPGTLLGRAAYDVWFGMTGNTPGKSLLTFVADKLASYKSGNAVLTVNFRGIERIGRRLELDGYELVQPLDVEMNLTTGVTEGKWEVV